MGLGGMDMQLKKICRGSGKIYGLVVVPQHLANCRLEVQSRLEDGTKMPANLFEYEANTHVLVLPVLDAVQIVTVVAKGEGGSKVAECVWQIHPQVAKLSSQVHTFLHDEQMERIRNYDARGMFGSCFIEVMRLVQAPHGIDIIQAQAMCISDDDSAATGAIHIEGLGSDGRPTVVGECVVLRDKCEPIDEAPGVVKRTMQFSVRINGYTDTLILWMRLGGDEGAQGFLCLRADELAYWRSKWRQDALPAFENTRYTEEFKQKWETPKATIELQRRTRLSVSPKFSIVVPLFKTPLAFFDAMVKSVIRQSYERFELILVNASPEDAELTSAVERWRLQDERIRVVELPTNLGIAENTNAGIKVATGDFLCFLDHDDMLAPDALFCYAHALEKYPTTDMFYSDEDHVEGIEYKHPYFKPDWSPDLMLGMNYVCHFLAVRKSVVDELELPTQEYDGAQDHYLALYVSERARNIYHCRRVLYHWRIHTGSTASHIAEKPYATEAGRLAVQAHLDRCGEKAKAVVSERAQGHYEVEYELDRHPLISILIPNKDSSQILTCCIDSILKKSDYQEYEIIIIENNSTEAETFACYERLEAADNRVRVVRYEGEFNYAKITNFGAKFAHGEYLLFLNNDIEVITPHWLTRLVSLCMRPSTGIVGAKLLFPDNTVQHAGVICVQGGGPDHLNKFHDADHPGYVETLRIMQDVSAVTGACLITKRTVFDAVDGLDERFAVDYNDTDYCWKVRKEGYLVVFDPSVVLYHYESLSRGFHTDRESQLRFQREQGLLRMKWPERLSRADPMSNPNFDGETKHYTLGWGDGGLFA